MAATKPCHLLINTDSNLLLHSSETIPTVNEIRSVFQNGSDDERVIALKKALLLLLSGEKMPQLLMSVIQFLMPLRDHRIKKLLLIYWEVVDKKSQEAEMILVCNFIRNDLVHPNEYVRGSTLRWISKLREPELLEHLIPTIRVNLEHKHNYVKKNAVFALFAIFKNFDFLVPDAPEIVLKFLETENDSICKRNAFLMLSHCAPEKASEYLMGAIDQVVSFPESMQFVVLEFIRNLCRSNPSEKSKFLRSVVGLLDSTSAGVRFEAASTLVTLSSAPTAIRAAASSFITLLCSQSDNNVKMIVLDKLLEIKKKYAKIMQELLLDVLRALSSPNMDVRKKTLEIAMDLVSPKNIEEVILVLKKEISKTQSAEEDKGGEYRQILIETIHSCAVKYPDVAISVVHVLMEFLGDSNFSTARDVISFVREVIETYPEHASSIVAKLVQSFNIIKSSEVYRAALWIIGEYSLTTSEIDVAFGTIKESLGDLPFVIETSVVEETNHSEAEKKVAAPTVVMKTRVLEDGTYSTQSALVTEAPSRVETKPQLIIRQLLLKGDFFLASALGTALIKLALRLSAKKDVEQITKNVFSVEVMLILVNFINLAKSNITPQSNDSISVERIHLCLRTLLESSDFLSDVYLKDCRAAFASNLILQKQHKALLDRKKANKDEKKVGEDSVIKIRQLRGRGGVAPPAGQDSFEDEDQGDKDLLRATGGNEKEAEVGNRLDRVVQLTGFSDPLYVEAFLIVHQYDIVLDLSISNQTTDTLQNVSIEFATLGDLKLVERPQTYTIAARSSIQVKVNIKVSSTETGLIFGSIVYDVAGKPSAADRNVVILSDIHIDIMDYIVPATCQDAQFRSMWAEFEWENKIIVNTTITNLNEFLDHIIKATNMKCLTPRTEGDCEFLAANLYAKSTFGEDALANVCIDTQTDGKIGGYIRIRSKTQGIALSIGDKITHKQRKADSS